MTENHNWTKATDEYVNSPEFETEEKKAKRRGNHKKRVKVRTQEKHTWGTIGAFHKRCTNCGATMDLTMGSVKYQTKRHGKPQDIVPKCSYKGL